jgi:diadenosine tetraphosphate (Ap4A) HIT family hydrolase
MMTTDCPFCHKLAHLNELPDEDIVGQFKYSVALLGPWQYYHGYCILIARRHAVELNHLSLDERRGYFDEMCLVASAIEGAFKPHKLNYELLGNQVRHLHWHLFPRRANEPDVLKPVWLPLDRAERDAGERQRLQTGPISRAETTALLKRCLPS